MPDTANASIRFQPAVTLSGIASESAFNIASALGPVMLLPKVVAAGYFAFKKVPSGICTCSALRRPSLWAISGSINIKKVRITADMLAPRGALAKPSV